MSADEPLRLGPLLRGPVLAGIAAMVLCLGGFGAWASLAQLSSAAVASGVVSPEGSRRTVQHLEGGIIRAILVAEGEAVAAGQPLLVLENVAARAQHEVRRRRIAGLRGQEARLEAEATGAAAIAFAPDLAGDPGLAGMLDDVRAVFDLRSAAAASRGAILQSRITQIAEQIAGLAAEVASLETQRDLIEQEVAAVTTLVDRGLERMPRLLGLQRGQAELDGAIGRSRAEVARLEQEIGETRLQLLDLEALRRQEAATALAETRAQLAVLGEELVAGRDVLARTTVTAPVHGRVIDLRFRTVGGVIAPGDPILDIVPADDALVIEARIAPADIDVLRPGLPADIHLVSFPLRNVPRLTGTVDEVSADRMSDQRSGEVFYLARVAVDRSALEALGAGITLTPGMPVEVMIRTGSRTPLAYLLGPIEQSFRRAFREQ